MTQEKTIINGREFVIEDGSPPIPPISGGLRGTWSQLASTLATGRWVVLEEKKDANALAVALRRIHGTKSARVSFSRELGKYVVQRLA